MLLLELTCIRENGKMMSLEIKTVEGKILATIKDEDFSQEKPLSFHFYNDSKDKTTGKTDIKWLKKTGSNKLVLN